MNIIYSHFSLTEIFDENMEKNTMNCTTGNKTKFKLTNN